MRRFLERFHFFQTRRHSAVSPCSRSLSTLRAARLEFLASEKSEFALGAAALPLHTRAAELLTILFPIVYLIGSAAADGAAVLVSLAFLYESFRTRDWGWIKRPWVLLVFVLWGYFTLRGAFAGDPGAAIGRAAAWIRYPLFAVALAFYALKREEARRGLLLSLSGALVFLMLDAALQYFWGRDIFGRLPQMSAEGSLRLTGPFKDPKVGIVLAWLGLPVMAGLLRRSKIHAAGFGLALVLAVFLSGERMALLLVLFGFGLLALSVRALRLPALAVVVLAAALTFVVAQTNPALMKRQYASTLHTIEHYRQSPYGKIWGSTAAMIEAHPVLGVGAKHFRYECAKPAYGPMDDLELRCNLHPHQLYLEWWVEGGVVALALFLALLFFVAKDVLAPWKVLRTEALYLGLLGALCIRIWPMSTSTSFFAAWSALPFWLVAGWLLAIAYREKRLEIRD